MPIYEYHCAECHKDFEELVSSSFKGNIECPACGSSHSERLLSVFGFVSKSNGHNVDSSSSGCSGCHTGHCGSCKH
ncbi:MAG: FmdB family transcriptional regulator [candidate division Zixibacteria bacterium CG_4_9_14_3_um_filter_46_8]|nr:MAG: FmdB family transcriptional regulator [candidate division Zixibacteria bacterium CG_4_9_14_3_um_filter_46_8]